MRQLLDQHNRIASYLRIGVTDRCNLRCRYCMPAEGIDFSDRKELLSYEEIIRLAHIFRELGVDKVRLTGGEPFVRKGIEHLLQALANIFPKVNITTNATLLQNHFDLLERINISGLNISIDSLHRERFLMITRRDNYERVMENILACLSRGLPVKLNVVTMQGVNDMEILDFVDFAIRHRVEVRFIEAMPFNQDDGNKTVFLSARDILNRIQAVHPSIQKLVPKNASSSDTYLIENQYKIGIIPAYTRSLCASCNRIRLTPKGEFLTCLYSKTGTDLRALLRDPSLDDEAIAAAILNSVAHKLKSGFEEEAKRGEEVFSSMTSIGG